MTRVCALQISKELLIVGEQPFELIGPEPPLGLDAEASQWLSDQGCDLQISKELLPPSHHPNH